MPEASPSSLVVEFIAQLALDRAEGVARPLAEYLARFPGADEEIAAAFVRASFGAATTPTPDPVSTAGAPDARRVGVYRLERELGRGGQASVYLAHDDRLGRWVALKIVPRSPLTDDLAPRFRREAELLASLDHPALAAIYDVGHDDAVAWIAMRYVEGETLARRLAASSPHPLPVDKVIEIGEQAARALHSAHEAGIVHRDVKPSNLMLTPSGGVVVLDFGVARHEDGEILTLSGEALGTPAYMAPEAFSVSSRTLDRAVDVWGLGVTLYEIATGRRPFEAPTRDALTRAIVESTIVPLRRRNPAIPRDLEIVLSTALEKDPGRRYRTAHDFAEDLRRVREHEPILARPASALVHLARFCRRNPALSAALASLALVLVVGLVVTGWLLLRSQRTLDEKESLLADVTQLSDQKVTRDLLAEEPRLWPAMPDRVADLARWLDGAARVIDRVPRHRAALERQPDGASPGATLDTEQEAWLREQLSQMLGDLDRLAARVPAVKERLAFAQQIERLTITDRAADWAAARDRVRADPRFAAAAGSGPLELEPQIGLIPLGPDPASGLEEFAVLATGTPPAREVTRDGASGRLAIGVGTALVLVLLPGGETRVGAVPPSPDHPLGSPRVDPGADKYDGPIVTVRLDPFLIAKHEMTQGEWLHHAGTNPSSHARGSKFLADADALRHPVETVSWNDATRVLAELGLELPTEAQWDYAARGGTDTPWWTGAEAASVQGAANLADRYAREHEGHPGWSYDLALDDGFSVHAPVGSFRANPFGLHDVLGNVAEYCGDTWEDWNMVRPRDGDGLCVGTEDSRVLRGGSYSSNPQKARNASREGLPPQIAAYSAGVRPARRLHRGTE